MSRRDRDILVEAGYFQQQGKENPMRVLNDHELDFIAAGTSNGNGNGHGRGHKKSKLVVVGIGTIGDNYGFSAGVVGTINGGVKIINKSAPA
jgi:hypothetical protein